MRDLQRDREGGRLTEGPEDREGEGGGSGEADRERVSQAKKRPLTCPGTVAAEMGTFSDVPTVG